MVRKFFFVVSFVVSLMCQEALLEGSVCKTNHPSLIFSRVQLAAFSSLSSPLTAFLCSQSLCVTGTASLPPPVRTARIYTQSIQPDLNNKHPYK